MNQTTTNPTYEEKLDEILRKRTEEHKLDLPEQDLCSKNNLIGLFIDDLKQLKANEKKDLWIETVFRLSFTTGPINFDRFKQIIKDNIPK